MTEHEDAEALAPRAHWESAWAVLGPLADLVAPMAVRVAATLGLADLLADRTLPAEELAVRCSCDPKALGCLLRYLVSRGVFGEPAPGNFANNEVSTLLRAGHPAGLGAQLDLHGFGGRMDLAFTGLEHTIRSGSPAWESVFGAPLWRYLAYTPEMSASFDAMMAQGADYFVDAAGGYDWSETARVIDVGGGNAALLTEILHRHPRCTGILVERTETAERARDYLAEQGLAQRCEVRAQSFFDPLPTGGDVYVLRSVLHDWDDEHASAILRRCAEAAGTTGRVVVIEQHGGANTDPALTAEMDLRMLVLNGGRERTVTGLIALAANAGLRLSDQRETPLAHLVLELRPGAS